MNILKVRIIVNGSKIYELKTEEKLIIPLEENNPKIVLTDGFHYTRPLEVVFHHIHTYYFRVACIIDNHQLSVGLGMIVICYLLGFATGFFLLKLLSFFPLIYFLFFYYINRKDFLQIRVA